MHLVFDYLGIDRYDPASPGFVALSVLQLALMATVVAMAFIALRPLENSPLSLWDGGSVDLRGIRSATVGLLLCTAGAATLTSVAWGLKDQGPYCVAVMLATLAAARWLASTPRIAATQRLQSSALTL